MTQSNPSFTTRDPNRALLPHLLTAFLELRFLSSQELEDGEIQESKDRGKLFPLFLEQEAEILKAIKEEGEAKVIISFQINKDFSRISVARPFATTKPHKGNIT